ncbi:MAG: class I SAM-dependent methyltransferase [Candidatus Promineifilaceae bacterium]|nr:class I SAM-dependent methyltransferase [Candidatus Promineifilaceae bacterium]
MQTYEAVEDATYLRERAARRRTFQSRLELLERHHDPALGRTLLDVGAYTGVFVEVARTAEWDAMGVEPSHWAIQVARDARLPVIQGTLLSPELVGRQFDAITMWDVIEHVSNPREELQRSYNLLAPGGLLLVHTMDIDSLTAKIMGSSWPWLMDMHLHYFSRQRLIWLLRDCGYEVVWHGTQGRFLSLGYLSSRLSAFNDGFAQRLGTLLRRLKLETVLMPVNFGDLFTVLARRPR